MVLLLIYGYILGEYRAEAHIWPILWLGDQDILWFCMRGSVWGWYLERHVLVFSPVEKTLASCLCDLWLYILFLEEYRVEAHM